MAHDYANRPKQRKPAARRAGPRSASQPAAPTPKRGLPWIGLLSLLLVAGFGFGLYKLAFVKPDPTVTLQSVKQRTESSPVGQPQATATPPASRASKPPSSPSEPGYKFYDLLPKSEVVPPKVEAYNSTPKSAKNHSRYLLQAGSFRNPADADGLRAKLILLGLPNVTASKVTSANGSVWYRVRLGPFDSRSKLNKAQDQLVRMNLQPMQVKLR